jgi:hypothetical protein
VRCLEWCIRVSLRITNQAYLGVRPIKDDIGDISGCNGFKKKMKKKTEILC